MRTWEVPVRNFMTIKVRSQKKDDAKKLAQKIEDLFIIQHYTRSYSGVIGESESESLYLTIGGRGKPLPYPEVFEKEKKEFLDSLPDVITDIRQKAEDAKRIFNRHVPVEDKRKTPSEHKDEQEKFARIDEDWRAEIERKKAEFVSEWCLPEKVDIPDDHMAVCLILTYDDSDAMSDYYSPYRSIGVPMLLDTVPVQPKKERTARNIISRFPELAKLSWSWHRETWSMGHGTFLLSDWTGIKKKIKTTDGRDEVNTRFEVRFNKSDKSMYPYKHYRGYAQPECKEPEPAEEEIPEQNPIPMPDHEAGAACQEEKKELEQMAMF